LTGQTTENYLARLGVPALAARTSAFDPGYDPVTVASHLEQSAHLVSLLKLSMACWQIASEASTRSKIAAAKRCDVPVVVGGGPFEVAVAKGLLPEYLDLVAELGVDRIEAGAGFTDNAMSPATVVELASERSLEVQFELGKKHGPPFTDATVGEYVAEGREWLQAGARQIVVEGRESARGVGLFDEHGQLNTRLADRFVDELGIDVVVFEAPNKPSQFALLDHFGPDVHLSNVRMEELLRVEIYRRGLHSDAFDNPKLRPGDPVRR
jgi:phosphosulfolactate synthase